MKLTPNCYNCLRGLIRQAADLATADALLKEKAMREAVRILDSFFSYDQISIVIAARIHSVIKEITGNTDPYKLMKHREMAIARDLYSDATSLYKDDFAGWLKLAASANAIDFFKAHSTIEKEMRRAIRFARDDAEILKTRLQNADRVLYLADNAGEVYFDLPLVKWMKQFAHVSYAVKPAPVQNDATLLDLREAGLEREFGNVITIETASPGLLFPITSARFKLEFEAANLIFAKGMGHYESLSEIPGEGRFFHCLMAKCQPVADSLKVPLNSYVAILR